VTAPDERWLREPARLQRLWNSRCASWSGSITVLRDDLLEGGSKLRFLPFLIGDAEEIVFGGPFCGGAPLALSVLGRELKRKITLFYAQRNQLHPRQVAAQRNGALLHSVPFGRMSVVQARAREYAAAVGALFLPLGFDVPAAEQPFESWLERLKAEVGSPDEVWCAAGSGMIARCLGRVFKDSAVRAVAVGLQSRHAKQAYTDNVELYECGYGFDQPSRTRAPFPACRNYEAKAWEVCVRAARGRVLFYNVLGEAE
jgi:hypothetical protein